MGRYPILTLALTALLACGRGNAAAAAPAPADAPRVIILLVSHEGTKISTALRHAAKLRQGGVAVRVIVQGEAALAYGDLRGIATPEKIEKMKEEDKDKPEEQRRRLNRPWKPLPAMPRERLAEARAAGVDVEVDAHAADRVGLLEELRKAGETLVGTKEEGVDLAPLVKQGYQVVVF